MRIISSYKDYYDGVQQSMFDPSIVYTRAERVVDGFHCGVTWRAYFEDVEVVTIGLCGELHQAFRFPYTEDWIHGLGDMAEALAKKAEANREWRPRWRYYQERIDRFVDETRVLGRLFAEHNVPVWVLHWPWSGRGQRLVLNEALRPYNFASVKDPFTAFVALRDYVGGVLQNPARPVPAISDEVMAEIKGFDPKMSFRKPRERKR